MTRKEIYAKIKSLDIADKIKKSFGDNYTRISSDKLEAFIKRTESTGNATKKNDKKIVVKTPTIKAKAPSYGAPGIPEAIARIVSTLQTNNLITANDANYILAGL